MSRAVRFLFGLVTFVFGLAIVLWVFYNTFIEQLPSYSGKWWQGLGMGPIFIGAGLYWMGIADPAKFGGGKGKPSGGIKVFGVGLLLYIALMACGYIVANFIE